MICKHCKNEIPDGSIFCNWCGERQVKERKKKDAIKVPKARQLKSGRWNIELKAEGQSITEETEEMCVVKAKAIRAAFVEQKKKKVSKTVGEIVDEYINIRSNLISPTTYRSYRHIRKYRFERLMETQAHTLTVPALQGAINSEAVNIAPKTLSNAWGLVKSALSPYVDLDLSVIVLPQKKRSKTSAYETEDLKKLFAAVEGDAVEVAVLLAACLGLRRSEILGLTHENINRKNNTITIDQARVPDENNELVIKYTKTEKSHRVLPCPQFILDKIKPGVGFIYKEYKQSYLLARLRRICEANDLPQITLHGLRHTNASVMLLLNIPDKYAMERGGWSNNQTMKNIYQHTLSSERSKADEAVNHYFEELVKR